VVPGLLRCPARPPCFKQGVLDGAPALGCKFCLFASRRGMSSGVRQGLRASVRRGNAAALRAHTAALTPAGYPFPWRLTTALLSHRCGPLSNKSAVLG
jgi:hypothetical protein